MKSDLEELILAYEQEKAELERDIARDIAESEFEYTAYNQKALWRVNRKLELLKDFHNPYASRIAEQERRITYLKNFRNSAANKYGISVEHNIAEAEAKILAMKQTVPEHYFDGQEIDDALFNLVERGKPFKFYFKSRLDIYARFQLKDAIIIITLGFDQTEEIDLSDPLIHMKKLSSLGFNFINNQWVSEYPVIHFKDAWGLKILLARMVYDVFYQNRDWDSARIVYE
ncbi:hypothetical protein [Pedobacter duraquae]|uniref:Uncharacterized protein n=1 Tax=Pedobacter duraquae TaxID=425511 RepID=A0A4R6IMJ7_9SPHI|nr:hypothetical protein [Pedobacter duraquae]TDO23175.1 hypothetical protein CLV32_2162 [Pedobacter duraquae]